MIPGESTGDCAQGRLSGRSTVQCSEYECCSIGSKRTVPNSWCNRRELDDMSRSFLVDSLIGNNSPPAYPLPYYGNQLPSYMFNFFNLGLGYQPIRPVPRPPAMPVPVPISPPALRGLPPVPGQSPPSPLNSCTSRLSGKYLSPSTNSPQTFRRITHEMFHANVIAFLKMFQRRANHLRVIAPRHRRPNLRIP